MATCSTQQLNWFNNFIWTTENNLGSERNIPFLRLWCDVIFSHWSLASRWCWCGIISCRRLGERFCFALRASLVMSSNHKRWPRKNAKYSSTYFGSPPDGTTVKGRRSYKAGPKTCFNWTLDIWNPKNVMILKTFKRPLKPSSAIYRILKLYVLNFQLLAKSTSQG